MEEKEISKAVIKRLPRYYRYLGDLLRDHVERISSKELSDLMNVTASQIRQDLNHFGGFGQQGYGYNVNNLYTEIGRILGLDTTHSMVILGAGRLGLALANYFSEEKSSFELSGIFDVNPALLGQMAGGVPVRLMDELPSWLARTKVEIGVLTLPKSEAAEAADLLVKNGIRAIWNFAHLDLDTPDNVIVENVHLSESLMTLSYNLSEYRKSQEIKE